MPPVKQEKKQQECSQQTHGTAIPFASLVSHGYLVAQLSPGPVLKFQHKTLYDMNEKSEEKHHFYQADNHRPAHKISSTVEHITIICSIEKVFEDAGIDTHVHQEEGNQKQTRNTHHDLFAYRGTEHLRPGHKIRLFNKGTLDWRKNNIGTPD
jgi:hypothetical protein